jgi:hypothetical protein
MGEDVQHGLSMSLHAGAEDEARASVPAPVVEMLPKELKLRSQSGEERHATTPQAMDSIGM